MKEVFKYGFTLGLICFLASAILATANSITEPQIRLQKAKNENLALKEAIPEAESFKAHHKDDKVIYYNAYDRRGWLNGFVVKCESKGYSSNIEAVVGLNLKLEIIKVKILSQNETPGLGSKILEPFFLLRFKDRSLDSLKQVDAITGATISSRAVINSINNTLLELRAQLLQEINNAR